MKIKSYRRCGDIHTVVTTVFLWWGEKEWRCESKQQLPATYERWVAEGGVSCSLASGIKFHNYLLAESLFGDQQ